VLQKPPSDLTTEKVVSSAGMLRRLMSHRLWAVTVLIMTAVTGTIILATSRRPRSRRLCRSSSWSR